MPGDDLDPKAVEEQPLDREMEEGLDRTLREGIALGEEAREFLASPLAEHMIGVAANRVENAYRKLGTINPRDHKGITELQTEIAKFNLFNRSLEEMVAAGDSAYQAFREQSAT